MILKRVNNIIFGMLENLNEDALGEASDLIKSFVSTNEKSSARSLDGRCAVKHIKIEDFGDVVIKQYARGGLLRMFVRNSYLRWGKTRGQREYEMLWNVRELGVNAPKPLAFAYRGSLFYSAWLITQEIKYSETLAGLSLRDEDQALALLEKFIAQLGILIRNRIFHVDLHPGNVIVNKSGEVFILDFDKAVPFSDSLNRLRDIYLRRWRRAVIKHKLPECISERVCLGLREHFDEE